MLREADGHPVDAPPSVEFHADVPATLPAGTALLSPAPERLRKACTSAVRRAAYYTPDIAVSHKELRPSMPSVVTPRSAIYPAVQELI